MVAERAKNETESNANKKDNNQLDIEILMFFAKKRKVLVLRITDDMKLADGHQCTVLIIIKNS